MKPAMPSIQDEGRMFGGKNGNKFGLRHAEYGEAI